MALPENNGKNVSWVLFLWIQVSPNLVRIIGIVRIVEPSNGKLDNFLFEFGFRRVRKSAVSLKES